MTSDLEEAYLQAMERWKSDVAETCDGFATNKWYDLDLDFYVFQSSVRFKPPLLIVGANPGGNVTYTEANLRKNRSRRTGSDLGYQTNQFLDNPAWRSNSLCDLFSGGKLRPMFEDAVITNLVYFNTNRFVAFKTRNGAKEAISYSQRSTESLINTLQPKNIILLGNIARDGLARYFDKPLVSILETKDQRSVLIRQTSINGIPVFCIHHPSMNKKFNSGENLELKRKTLENLL